MLGKMRFRWITCSMLLSLVGISQEKISEASISRFPALPGSIKQDLRDRGCTVPQPHSGGIENVIRGKFIDAKQIDWAVLCDMKAKNTSQILVYWAGEPSDPAVLRKEPLAGGPCWRSISPVGKAYITEHYQRYGGPKPPVIEHEGINVGICDKASTISYFYRDRWLTLTGAD
jgi:hypothetical protein